MTCAHCSARAAVSAILFFALSCANAGDISGGNNSVIDAWNKENERLPKWLVEKPWKNQKEKTAHCAKIRKKVDAFIHEIESDVSCKADTDCAVWATPTCDRPIVKSRRSKDKKLKADVWFNAFNQLCDDFPGDTSPVFGSLPQPGLPPAEGCVVTPVCKAGRCTNAK
ncbi:MAG: hypothetical protein ABL958_02300 [Bdellovibrionia bacterium]